MPKATTLRDASTKHFQLWRQFHWPMLPVLPDGIPAAKHYLYRPTWLPDFDDLYVPRPASPRDVDNLAKLMQAEILDTPGLMIPHNV